MALRNAFQVSAQRNSIRFNRIVRNEKGQATTEYILLMAVIVGFYTVLAAGINRLGIAAKLAQPITTTFAAAYQYGHTKAKGYEDGPENHPRAVGGAGNFRIFFNPDVK